MNIDDVYDAICGLIEDAPQNLQDEWNFITDIDTNEIREGCEDLAIKLLEKLQN